MSAFRSVHSYITNKIISLKMIPKVRVRIWNFCKDQRGKTLKLTQWIEDLRGVSSATTATLTKKCKKLKLKAATYSYRAAHSTKYPCTNQVPLLCSHLPAPTAWLQLVFSKLCVDPHLRALCYYRFDICMCHQEMEEHFHLLQDAEL